MVAAPGRLDSGVIVTVRLKPRPLSTILVLGTTLGFKDRALIVRCLAGVSASLTLNLIETLVFSGATTCGASLEMVGGVFCRTGAARSPTWVSNTVAVSVRRWILSRP